MMRTIQSNPLKKSMSMIRLPILVWIFMACFNNAWSTPDVLFTEIDKPRVRENFSANWKFHFGDLKQAEQPELDHSGWRTLDVPHDWSIERPMSARAPDGSSSGYRHGGIGWYRKHFTMPAELRGQKVVIDFDGVYMNSEVWINGHHLGFRPFGYVGFRYDLTPHLNFGGENVVAVRTHVKDGASRWYPGGGIYRRVWLTAMDPLHVAHWGTHVTTPEVSEAAASVRMNTEVENERAAQETVTLKSVIVDPQGRVVAEASSEHGIATGAMHRFEQEFTVENPMLWSPDTPDLYSVVSTVKVEGVVVDRIETPLGIRSFEFTKDRGLIFNGEKMDVKGVCLHQDFGPLGVAFNPRAMERRLEIMREMGCNAIRTSHNPRDPEFYALCDRMGFLVMDEVFDEWKIPKLWRNQAYALYFDEWSERDLTDVIRRDRNHPSVVMWSIGNEINEQYKPNGGEMSARLAAIVKHHDMSRPITAGCNSPSHAKDNGFEKALDVFGLNYSYHVYDELKGERAMIGTENSTDWSTRGSYSFWRPLRGDLQIQQFKNDIELSAYGTYRERDADLTLRKMRASPWVAGQFTWTGFDYRGEAHPLKWPNHSGVWGIVDLVGFPKDQYYLYQSDWSDKPVVHILPQNWNWSQYPGAKVPVWVYSNCDEVELQLNGKSLGFKTIDREQTLRFEWKVPYRPGTLKAIGWKNGKPVCTQQVSTTSEPAKLQLVPDRTEIAADGSDLSYVEVRVTDEHGRICPDADRNLIHFEVIGDGKIVGVCNGSSYSHDDPKGKKVHAFRGLCIVVVQSTRQSGKIKLKAVSDGLKEAEAQITTLPENSDRLKQLALARERKFREESAQYSRHRLAKLAMKNGRSGDEALDAQALKDVQEELAAYAEQELSATSLQPTVRLSARLKQLEVTATQEGGNVGQMRNVLGRKDWLRALQLLNPDANLTTYPNRREIGRLANELRNHRYTINLQPAIDLKESETLYYMVLREDDRVELHDGWYVQSGFGGWTHAWQPRDREVFIFVGPKNEATKQKLLAPNQKYQKEIKHLSEKHGQGEFSDAQFNHQCDKLKLQYYQDYIDLLSKF